MIETPRQRRVALACLLACLAALGILTVLVATSSGALQSLDEHLSTWPHRTTLDHSALKSFWIAVGATARTVPLGALVLLTAGALFGRGHRRAAVWLLLVMVTAEVAFRVLKALLGRDRPQWDQPIQTLSSPSFPSGHATDIAAAAGAAIVLAWMLIRRRGLRRLVLAVAVALALLVGADRIFLGVHWSSDVVAGYLLGTVVVLATLFLYDPLPTPLSLTAEPLLESVPPGARSLAVVLNPVKVDDPGGFRAMVERMAAESGWTQVVWWETTEEDTGYQMAHEAAVWGADLVVAVGGDGTVRAVCEELAGTGIPVGIVPAGTGNLLARNLSLPLYLRAAVDVALNGQDRAIDLVSVSGDEMEDATFLVMAGMGFDAAIMEGVNESFKKRVGWLAYVWSGLKALMFPAIRVEVSVDGGEPTVHRARTVVIGNVGNLQAGMPLLPEAAIDDGQVDVVLLYPRRFLSWLPLAARVLTRAKRTDETLTRMTGRSVVVRASTAAPRQIDGDLLRPGHELRAECQHGRLLVRVPR